MAANGSSIRAIDRVSGLAIIRSLKTRDREFAQENIVDLASSFHIY
jgi:hypothetical protein